MIIDRLRFRYRHYFLIDDLGKGIASKIIFLIMLGCRVGPNFLPKEYTDFTALYDWITTVLTAEEITPEMMVTPLSRENYIFIALSFLALYICSILALLYSGLFTRHLRNLTDMNPNIPLSKFVARYIVLCIIFAVIAMPMAFVIVYLLLLFFLAIPFLSTIAPCYMSGDRKFFDSIGSTIKRTRGHYLLMMRDLCGIILVYLITNVVITLIELLSPTVAMALSAAIEIWFYLVFARFCSYQYTITKKN